LSAGRVALTCKREAARRRFYRETVENVAMQWEKAAAAKRRRLAGYILAVESGDKTRSDA
jgi:hypothetical protein